MINCVKSWFSKHSLNFKLNVSILSCVGLGSLALLAFIFERSAPIIEKQIESNAKLSVDAFVSDFTNTAIAAERVVLSAKNTLSQVVDSDITSFNMVLKSALQTVNDAELNFTNAWIYVFAPEDVSRGDLYFGTVYEHKYIKFHTERVDNFYVRFPWFKDVPKEEKIYWSEPYIDTVTGQTVITCLVPFRFSNKDDFDGLMALTIDLSDVQSQVRDFSFYESGKLLLLSKSGLYVAHPDENIALKMTIFELSDKLKLPQLFSVGKALQAGLSGHVHIPYSSVVSGPAIFFYAPIKHIGWGVCLVYSQNEFLRPMHQFQITIILALLFGIALLLFLINRICHHSTTQLILISDIATQYGNGDFSKQFDGIPSTIDINRLATALTNMRTNLMKYIKQEKDVATEKQRVQSELEIARNIQKSALSTTYPENQAFDLATVMLPAKHVGGDFYDFFFIDDDKFAIVIADVSGKGIPAALYMMKAITLIKNISKGKLAPEVVFEHTNNQLNEGNDTFMFVTAFMAVINLKTGDVDYVNAGHNPPLIGDENGYAYLNPIKNVVLGVRPNAKFVAEHLKLMPHQHIFLYTDGVTEAQNVKSKFYGEERLRKILQRTSGRPCDNLKLILNDIKKFAKDVAQSDDITMLDFVYTGKEKNMVFDADAKLIPDVLNFIKQDMSALNIDQKTQFNAITAVEEIFSNIAFYAYPVGTKGKVTMSTTYGNSLYTVTLIDEGRKYNPLENKDPDVKADFKDREIGGLGVLLAKKLSSKISYSRINKQNVLSMSFEISR